MDARPHEVRSDAHLRSGESLRHLPQPLGQACVRRGRHGRIRLHLCVVHGRAALGEFAARVGAGSEVYLRRRALFDRLDQLVEQLLLERLANARRRLDGLRQPRVACSGATNYVPR